MISVKSDRLGALALDSAQLSLIFPSAAPSRCQCCEWSTLLQAAAQAAAKADDEPKRIAVTEALELRESELKRELKENDPTRQQKAKLNRQLKDPRRELAAGKRPKNRFAKSKESCKHLATLCSTCPPRTRKRSTSLVP